jgi:hypothetical protein
VKDRDEQGHKVFASDWEHAWRARQKQYDKDKWEIHYALFGEHLLKKYPNAIVNVVESEKTAIIMANYYDDFDSQIWMACGGLQWLQLDKFQPLIDQGRTIWLWPDKDGRDEWQTVADKLGYDHCRVYTHFFDTCWIPADGDKADIADIAIRMMRTGEGPRAESESEESEGQVHDSSKKNQATCPHDSETCLHDSIMNQIGEYVAVHPDGEPFLPEDEMADPRLRLWREILRQRYNFKR